MPSPTPRSFCARIPCDDVSPAAELLPAVSYDASLRATLGLPKDSPLEAWSRDTKPLVRPGVWEGRGYPADVQIHGLVNAVNSAYAWHYPLVLSPDMIWLLIAQGAARHIGVHAEALRSRLVAHTGKLEIKVERHEFLRGFAGNDWEGTFAEFAEQIRAHIMPGAYEGLVQRFSTTGPVEQVAMEVTLMDAFQTYFNYTLVTLCGIPEIFLEGTPDDWRKLRSAISYLPELELNWWGEHLAPVLDEFVAAAEGKVNPAFWKHLYKLQDESGGPIITGHLLTFFPYLLHKIALTPDERTEYSAERKRATDMNDLPRTMLELGRIDRKWQGATRRRWEKNPFLGRAWEAKAEPRKAWSDPGTEGIIAENLPNGVASTPFLWKYYGDELPMRLSAGFVGFSQDPTTLALRPEIGWAIFDEPT